MQRLTGILVAGFVAASLMVFAPSAIAGNGADGVTFYLASYDGTSLLGVNDEGRTVNAALDSSTTYKLAQLDKYDPTDPYHLACRAAAGDYNDALDVVTGDGSVFAAAIDALASGGCKAIVVASPGDIYLPPNPVRILSFQPVP
jgi:hypothetical protein